MERIDRLREKFPLQKWSHNPYLRTISEVVEKIDNEIITFSNVLKELMIEYDWVWLAAPQLAVNKRIIAVSLMRYKWRKKYFDDVHVMINPEIIDRSEQISVDEEWCLSFPWLYWEVDRFDHVVVKYLDLDWTELVKQFSKYNARILQHEIDHLDAVLLPDRLKKKPPLDLRKFLSVTKNKI